MEEKSNYVENKEKEEESTLLLAFKAYEGGHNSWYLDTGVSYHICRDKSIFVEVEDLNGHVTFGDALKVEVKGRGKVLIQMKNGQHQYISNVYYVPSMKNNILSLGQLLEKEYDILMKN